MRRAPPPVGALGTCTPTTNDKSRRTLPIPHRPIHRGITLLELLVVIAIVGLLAGLVLPAVHAAREAGRRTQCQNHLKQQALALLDLELASGSLPTAGWGGVWVGDPERGTGVHQPGGWIYCVLPYLEQRQIRELGLGASAAAKPALLAQVVQLPLSVFNCPTRRPSMVYAISKRLATTPLLSAPVSLAARTDYAANAGDQSRCEIANWFDPRSLAQGDDPSFKWPDVSDHTGVCFLRSQIKLGEVRDGTSHTYLVGEKQLNSADYESGANHGDDWSMYTGYQDDICRCAVSPPESDFTTVTDTCRFGSAHPGGWNTAFCDGRVRWMNFDLDPAIHRRLANRADHLAVNGF